MTHFKLFSGLNQLLHLCQVQMK